MRSKQFLIKKKSKLCDLYRTAALQAGTSVVK